jgi:hypothetical protein
MTIRNRRPNELASARALRLALMSVSLLSACGGDTVEPPLTGTLHLRMRTSGASFDGDGYTYQVGSTQLTLAVQDTLDIPDLPAGPVPLALGGLADNCRAFSPGPSTVTIHADAVDTVSLVVSCDSALRNVVLFVRWPSPRHPEVWMMRPDGSGEERIIADAAQPVATPNGTQIVYWDWTTLRLSIIRADRTKRHPLVPDLGGGQYEPDVSPDGRLVVFSRSTSLGADLYRSTLDGDDIQQLTAGAFDGRARWSRDGRFITFTRWGGDGRLYRIPAEGGEPVPLTAQDEGCCASWSPDGARLVFYNPAGPEWRTMAADGSNGMSLDALPASTTSLEWSPDGTELMTVRYEDPSFQVWRVPLDGRAATHLTEASAVGSWLP